MPGLLAVQQVEDLDRTAIRERALERFSPIRMAEEYEAVYARLVEPAEGAPATPVGAAPAAAA